MKGLLKFLTGALLGGLLGWGLGYVRLPLVEVQGSYWAGVATGLGAALLLLGLAYARSWPDWLLRRWGAKPRPMLAASIWGVAIVAIGAAACGWLLHRQEQDFETRQQARIANYNDQMALVEAERNSQQVALMGGLIEEVNRHVKEHPGDSISESIVQRLATLSLALKPYRYFRGDSLTPTRLSPERAHLLMSLLNSGLDSTSWARIKKTVDFSYSDLNGYVLRGKDLGGIRLGYADLRSTDLRNANLSGADLRESNLFGARLDSADLSRTSFFHAIAPWSIFTGANMHKANLNGADLSNATMLGVNMERATFRFASGAGIRIWDANLRNLDLYGTKLNLSDIRNCVLDSGNLFWVNFDAARVEGLSVNEVRVTLPTWKENWEEWHLPPIADWESQYEVVPDSLKKFGVPFKLVMKH